MFDRPLDCFEPASEEAVPAIHPARPETLGSVLDALPPATAAYVRACGFTGQPGRVLPLPGEQGVAGALLGLGDRHDPYVWGALATDLPAGVWRLAENACHADAVFGFAAGAYRFDRLQRRSDSARPRLMLPDGADIAEALAAAKAMWLVRDLINTPANHLGPAELAEAARLALASRSMHAEVIEGAALADRYPAIHAVGLGSDRPPCVLNAQWRSANATDDAPLISLCGKGVCFDTGGYDIKPSSGMLRMKKDMGGAAIALGVACLIVERDLPVRLELRLGCAENMISGNAMRPSDVIATRAGLTVEVGNTDAEGRLVLCDLLAEASSASPAMLLDFATLTGAARVALGPDVPAMFTNSEGLASVFLEAGACAHDPVWRMPLWNGYNSWLDSTVADLNNVSEKAHAGAIIAALFLQCFVCKETPWAHFDVYAWNDTGRPGKPVGGEAQAMRTAFQGVARFVQSTLTSELRI